MGFRLTFLSEILIQSTENVKENRSIEIHGPHMFWITLPLEGKIPENHVGTFLMLLP